MNPKTFSQIESIENAIESYKVKLPNKAEDTKYQLSMLLQKLKDNASAETQSNQNLLQRETKSA